MRHFLGRGFVGKAMVVSIDKATALRMFNKVKQHWAVDLANTQKELGELAYVPTEGGMTAEQARREVRMDE